MVSDEQQHGACRDRKTDGGQARWSTVRQRQKTDGRDERAKPIWVMVDYSGSTLGRATALAASARSAVWIKVRLSLLSFWPGTLQDR